MNEEEKKSQDQAYINWALQTIQNSLLHLSLTYAQEYGDYLILLGKYAGQDAIIKSYDICRENSQWPINASKLARWRRQTYALPLVQHPNIVKMRIHTTKQYQIIFERYNGITLYDFLKTAITSPLICNFHLTQIVPEDLARFILKNLVYAVRAIHKKGLAHLNINITNVMIIEEPSGKLSIKLIDFGYSCPLFKNGDYRKILADSAFENRSFFLPPDYHDMIISSFDSYDVYSMGLLLFSLVTGFPPYVSVEIPSFDKKDKQKESLYSMLYKEDFEGFWAKIRQTYHAIYNNDLNLSSPLINCINFMLNPNSSTRYTMPELDADPWMNIPLPQMGQLYNLCVHPQ